MASEIRVNKIENRSGLGTVTFADTGVDLAGIVTATTFSGSGASLTNLPAGNLSGTLPAISAANLTNIPAANVTGTLPAISAANLTNIPAANVTGTLPAISAANLTQIPAANIVGVCTAGLANASGVLAGVTMVDQWRVNVDRNLSGISELIDANWERNDGAYFGQLGTGMSQSSGVFTFPSTGIYLVSYNLTMYSLSLTQRYSGAVIQVTTNNSSYAAQATSYFNAGVSHGSGCYMCGECNIIIDVTDTSTHKVRFIAQSATAANAYVAANSNENITFATFTRLGDT